MARHILTAVLLLAASARCLQAQQNGIVFERIRVPGGIEENRVNDLVQDQQGFLWLGTTGGLFKYDGYTFVKYGHQRFRDTGAPPQQYETIWDLYLDRAGFLWIATNQNGLHRLDPRTDEMISYRHDPDNPNSISSNDVPAVIVDSNGIIWAGTRRGLDRIDPSTKRFVHYRCDPQDPTSLSSNYVWRLYEDRDGTVWVGTRRDETGLGGLHRFEPETGTFTRYLADPEDESTLGGEGISAVYEDSHDRLWVGTFGRTGAGLQTMNRRLGSFTRYPPNPGKLEALSLPYPSGHPELPRGVTSFHEDRAGMLWIGAHTGGINLHDPETKRVAHFDADPEDPTTLSNNFVTSIAESEDGVVWVGTLSRGEEGLNKGFRVSPFRFYPIDEPAGQTTTISEITDGTLVVGTDQAGLYRIVREEAGSDRDSILALGWPSLTRESLPSVFGSRDGRLWVSNGGASRYGFSRFDLQWRSVDKYLNNPRQPDRSLRGVNAIYEDARGWLWIGTVQDGFASFDPTSGALKRYRHDPVDPRSLSNDRVERNGILETADGSLWILTRGALNRFDRSSQVFERYFTERTAGSRITGISEERDGHLWIGWFNGGLVHFDPASGEVEEVDTRNAGLPGSAIRSMILDDLGNLWVMTEKTLARFDVVNQHFYSYEPRRSTSFVAPGQGVYKDDDGELFFGAVNGVLAFRPEQLLATENHMPPRVALTALYVNGKKVVAGNESPLERPIGVAKTIRLHHGQDAFSIDFVGLHYLDPKRNRHMYKLEGVDEHWRDAGTERRASYRHVPPGSYVFRAKSANPFGVWSEKEASISVVILPAWWQSWWAYCLYVVGLGLMVYAGHEVRVRHFKKRAERLGILVDERTRELQAEKSRTEAQAKRLIELDEVKDRFFFNMSHEFRTPLTLVLGPLHDLLAGSDGEISPGLRRKLLVMQRNGQRLYRLIRQLLDLSKLEVGRMPLQARERDLVAFIRHILLSFSPAADRRGITLTFRADVKELPVFIDTDKLEHVVTNLLSNALKFTSEHGRSLSDSPNHCREADGLQKSQLGTQAWEYRRRSFRSYSTVSTRSTLHIHDRVTALESGLRWLRRWWNCTAGRSKSRARRVSGRHLLSACAWAKTI